MTFHIARVYPVIFPGQGRAAVQNINDPPLYEKRIDAVVLDRVERERVQREVLLEYARARGKALNPETVDIESSRIEALERRLAEMEAASARPIKDDREAGGVAGVEGVAIDEATDGALDELISSHGISIRAGAGRRAKIAALRNNGVEFVPSKAVRQ